MSINNLHRKQIHHLFEKENLDVSHYEMRGHYIFFEYENIYVVCKYNELKLFDFIEFTKEDAAKHFFNNQRVSKKTVITKQPRIREDYICIRTLVRNL